MKMSNKQNQQHVSDTKVSGLKIGFININGIQNKVDRIQEVMQERGIDVLGLVETWLVPGTNLGIRPVLLDRRNQKKSEMCRGNGGIVVLCSAKVREGSKVKVADCDEDNRWVIIQVGTTKIIFTYIEPTAEEKVVLEILERVEDLMKREEVVVLGDLNARMRKIAGDRINNRRGVWLAEFLSNSRLAVRAPDVGKWTTFTMNGGRGITDYLIINQEKEDRVRSYKVVEKESMDGSDHRLLLAEIDMVDEEEGEEEEGNAGEIRWNVLQLKKEKTRERFKKEFEQKHFSNIRRVISQQRKIIEQWVSSDVAINIRDRTKCVERMWEALKGGIIATLQVTCGAHKSNTYTSRDFKTLGLENLRIAMRNQEERVQSMMLNKGNYTLNQLRQEWRKLKNCKKEVKRRCEKRKTVVFRRKTDMLEDPKYRGELLRMVNSIKKRDLRGKDDSLKVDNMTTYREHFLRTLGARPEGERQEFDPNTVRRVKYEEPLRIKKAKHLTIKDVEGAIQLVAQGKASGTDGIPGEVWKIGSKEMKEVLRNLFEVCEQLACIPKDWQICLVVPVYKQKGDKEDIKSYRPISVTCIIRKIFEKVVVRHINKKIEKKLTPQQGGFRNKRGTYDQIFQLHEIMNQGNVNSKVVFMDLATAYDCIDRRILWTLLVSKYKVKLQAVRILSALFDNNKSVVLIQGERATEICNYRGLIQGSALSPCLFNAYIDTLSCELKEKMEYGIVCRGRVYNHLMYADDTVLMSDSSKGIQELVATAGEWSKRYGMKFNPTKCKLIAKKNDKRRKIKLYGRTIEAVKSEPYLGITFHRNGIHWEETFDKRIIKATNRIHWLKRKGMNATGWRIRMSLAVYKAFVRPMLEYGMGLTILPKKVMQRIQKVQNLALTKMLSVGRNTSTDVMHLRLNMETMQDRNQSLNLRYMERVLYGGDKALQPIGKFVARMTKAHDPELKQIKRNSLLKSFYTKNEWGVELVQEASQGRKSERISDETIQKYIRKEKVVKARKHQQKAATKIWSIKLVEKGDQLLNVIGLERRLLYLLWRWNLGTCGGGWRECSACGADLTSEHFLTCVRENKGIIREWCDQEQVKKLVRGRTQANGGRRNEGYETTRSDTEATLNLNRYILRGLEDVVDIEKWRQVAELLEQCMVTTRDWQIEDGYDEDEDPNDPLNKQLKSRRDEWFKRIEANKEKEKKRKK